MIQIDCNELPVWKQLLLAGLTIISYLYIFWVIKKSSEGTRNEKTDQR